MPHDGIPRNGRRYYAGLPGRNPALALALALGAAALAVAAVTGLFTILLPALAVVAAGYALYLLIAASRRRARLGVDWERLGVIHDGRAPRRRSRLRRR